ncbi:hypothetical protein PoB_001787400 [Plakobranchus ocellatus]|uniref:Uncharacterized protein n=1 Tax=Plakobranchus ocellatus TaxID=259542 RepID=A0AAV3ZAF8_9GAST|nr:hypothetical protein PoB_001787400 [Plakobranchus ocellatus]
MTLRGGMRKVEETAEELEGKRTLSGGMGREEDAQWRNGKGENTQWRYEKGRGRSVEEWEGKRTLSGGMGREEDT